MEIVKSHVYFTEDHTILHSGNCDSILTRIDEIFRLLLRWFLALALSI